MSYIMNKLEDFGSKLNFFLWDYFPSPILNQFIKGSSGVKFVSGSDRIFILAEMKFYMFANAEIFSKKNEIHYTPFADIKVLAETLDILYPNETQVVILYGLNELNRKKCIVIYDFIQGLILCTIFLPSEFSTQKPFIRANTSNNHIISHIVLAFKDHILIYQGPFENREVNPPQVIDITKNKILLLQFGKINFYDSDPNGDSPKSTHDVLYLITQADEVKLRAFISDDPSSNNTIKPSYFIIEKNDFEFIPSKCLLLDPETICFEVRDKSDSKLVVTKFIVDVSDQSPKIIEYNSIHFKIEDELTLLRGFSHYILTINKKNFLCVYDYKFIPDLTKEDYKSNFEISSKGSFESSDNITSKENIICVLSVQCKFYVKYIFNHMSRVFLLRMNNGNANLSVLSEDKPSNIVNKLVSSNKYFEYAKQQALLLSMPPSEIAEIEWKQANFIFNNPELDEITRAERAMDHFIETIGYKESSYVIQLYMNYKEETLIRYLWGNNEEPSPKSLIMNPKTGSLENRKLLISICVKLYSENKTKLAIDKSKKSLPMEILNYMENPNNEEFENCRDSLIDAFLAMDRIDEAIKLAENTNNYERTLKLLFDTENKNSGIFSKIVNILFTKKDITTNDKMKYLAEYARELFYYDDTYIIKNFINEISTFACSLIADGNETYIQEICLLFVPQLSSVLPELTFSESSFDLTETSINSDMLDEIGRNDIINANSIDSDDSNNKYYLIDHMNINDKTRMSILFYDFYQRVMENLYNGKDKKRSNSIKYPSILNDVYIQHLIILCRYEHLLHPDIKEESNELFQKLKEALIKHNYTTDVIMLSIIDLPEERYKFKLLKFICLSHKEYASNLIHLVSILKDITENEISKAVLELCHEFGQENPNLYLEAIAEFIQQGRCVDTIPMLLSMSSELIPLPDIITYILQLDQSMDAGKLNLKLNLISTYVVNWMNAMLEYEQQLKDQIEIYDQELQDIRNTQYSLKEMKDIRDEYKKMVDTAAKQPSDSDSSGLINSNLKFKRPFSLVPNYNTRNILSSSSKASDSLKRGTTMPSGLLTELESGVLVDGLDSVSIKAKQHFTPEADKMITEFDKMFEILNQ